MNDKLSAVNLIEARSKNEVIKTERYKKLDPTSFDEKDNTNSYSIVGGSYRVKSVYDNSERRRDKTRELNRRIGKSLR